MGIKEKGEEIERQRIIESNKGNMKEIYTKMTESLLREDLKKLEESGRYTKNKDGSYSKKGDIYKRYSKKDILKNLQKSNQTRYNKKIINYIQIFKLREKEKKNFQ